MFDYMTGGARPARAARLTTTTVSAIVHAVIIVALVIPALYATDALPEPEEAMAFFVSAPPPPPPPPPAPAPMLEKPVPAKPTPRTATARPVVAARRAPAAPVEAPKGIAPETGFEVEAPDVFAEAGFERGVPGGIVGGVIGGIVNASPPPPPPPAPAPRAPIRVGGEIKSPRLIHRVEPDYPLIAQHAQIQGLVILEAAVDREGRVNDVRVLRSHSFLNEAAVAAVRQWRYEPLMLNGEPQPFVLTVTVSFSIPGDR